MPCDDNLWGHPCDSMALHDRTMQNRDLSLLNKLKILRNPQPWFREHHAMITPGISTLVWEYTAR